MSRLFRRATVVVILGVMTFGLAAPAFAHEQRTVGKYKFTVGWGEEPLYAGFKNSVQFILQDSKGKPVTDLGDTLKLAVVFSGQTVTLPLVPTFDPDTGLGTQGEYRAWFIPTRPGNYTFHFTGSIKGKKVDQSFTSSETTFDPVKAPSEAQFPAKDPSTGDLATLVSQSDQRLAADIKKAKDDAGTATILAIIGLAIGALGLGAAVIRRQTPKQA